MSKIALLDPCYHKQGGHHHSVNRRISANLKAEGIRIYADRALTASSVSLGFTCNTEIIPIFEDIGYVDPDLYRDVGSFCSIAASCRNQFLNIKEKYLIAHTLLHFHLYGLALSLHSSHNKRVMVSLMFSPYEGLREEADCATDFLLTSLAIKALDRVAATHGHSITLGITSEYHRLLYQRLSSQIDFLDFEKSPWLVGYHNNIDQNSKAPSTETGTNKSSKYVVLYIGDAKPDKGIFRVLEFLEWVVHPGENRLSLLPEDEKIAVFITYCDEWLRDTVDRIKSICAQEPSRLMFTGEHLSERRYFEVLANAAKVVWLYDQSNYKYRTSGIFYDVVTIKELEARPIDLLISRESWMASESEQLGIPFGSIDLTANQWKQRLLKELAVKPKSHYQEHHPSKARDYYLHTFENWIKDGLKIGQEYSCKETAVMDTSKPLVISTRYSHFTRLSGPTGFVPYLEDTHHFKAFLGKSQVYQWKRVFTGLKSATDGALDLETMIISKAHGSEVRLIAVDGEHCGSLLAKALRDGLLSSNSKIYAWFHQPVEILKDQIFSVDQYAWAGITPICISPCQISFFQNVYKDNLLPIPDLRVIPHGIHEELLDIGGRAFKARQTAYKEGSCKITNVLTVGSWLRDRDLLYEVASLFPSLSFTWVSNGLQLNAEEKVRFGKLENMHMVVDGVTDARLHHIYAESDLLFQPLISATANNAILEGMSFGLPVLTKAQESTRWYTSGCAYFYENREECVGLLTRILHFTLGERMQTSRELRFRSCELSWSLVAELFKSLP